MRSKSGLTFLALILGALAIGTAAGYFGIPLVAAALCGAIGLCVLLLEYRIGVVLLMLMIPFLGLTVQGPNIFMGTIFLTAIALAIKKCYSKNRLVALPRYVWFSLISIILFGAALGFFSIDIARAAMADDGLAAMFSVRGYTIINIVFPLGVIFTSWLVGSIARDSRRPELTLIPIGAGAAMVGLQILLFVLSSGRGLDELSDSTNREVFGQLGHHANAFGPMLAVAAGPFLFLTADTKGISRLFSALTLGLILVGCALVFSRGGYLAFLVVFFCFLYMKRSLRMLLSLAIVGALAATILPDAVLDRATTGFDEKSVSMAAAGDASDPLTAGRLAIFEMFLPEIERSPVVGSGTASAAWSVAVRNGWTKVLHPHNTYLRVLMDVGILGLLLWCSFWYITARRMKALSKSSKISPIMRSYFGGSFAGVLGYLAAGVSGGPHWLPDPDQIFLWHSIGLTFCFWPMIAADEPGEGRLVREGSVAPLRSRP